jgi:hypothetical protein
VNSNLRQFSFATLALVLAVSVAFWPTRTLTANAQQGGVATVVGGVSPTNLLAPTVATGVAGTTTNPASNFIINVSGGPVYFSGSVQTIGASSLTLPANSTNLVVWNGFNEQVYSKQAVTGPGSSGTSVGVPTTLLFADPTRGELAIATIVCNATACGNGGNGSITDNRVLSNFPATYPLPGSTFAALPAAANGSVIFCTDCNATCTAGASTGRTCFRENGAWTH